MKTFIITEGSITGGTGHLTRCISLYQAFEEKGINPEFIVNGDSTVTDLLKDKKHTIFDWLEEKERLFDMVRGADISIIDSYLADKDIYAEISGMTATPVYLDDFNRLDYPEGIVINGTIGAERSGHRTKKGITRLLGTRYVPLRKEFRYVQKKETRNEISTVMVTFGGCDTRNMTPGILRLLVKNFPELNKKVIIGKGFQNTDEIKQSADSRTEIIYCPDAKGMKKVMLISDIAISAGGQTQYELARVGIPAIVIAVADNQFNSIAAWQKQGFIEYAGWWDNSDVLNNVMNRIQLLKDKNARKEKARTGRMLVDGLGAGRSVEYCLERYFEDGILLRTAQMSDMRPVYDLSNESEVRQNSFNSKDIRFEHHRKWFVEKINDEGCLFLIAEINGSFLGQVRFDIDKHEAVISISISRDYRGIKVGRIINIKALKYLGSVLPGVRVVKAYVKESNTPSARFFERSNFKLEKGIRIKDHDALEYLYQFKEGQNEIQDR